MNNTYTLSEVYPERSRRDAENRLTAISGAATANFTYDADGARIKSVLNGETVTTIGAYYEKMTSGSSTTITKYYQAGGQRIALRVNGVVRWLATDHLGSTALTASETGGRLSEIRYKPWGESRYTFGTTPTQRRFTGQVLDDVAGGTVGFNLTGSAQEWMRSYAGNRGEEHKGAAGAIASSRLLQPPLASRRLAFTGETVCGYCVV
ncbi:MAG: hypothetical protein WBR35_13670 [Anaerolineae bacterium]